MIDRHEVVVGFVNSAEFYGIRHRVSAMYVTTRATVE